jgi:hypothetical protein
VFLLAVFDLSGVRLPASLASSAPFPLHLVSFFHLRMPSVHLFASCDHACVPRAWSACEFAAYLLLVSVEVYLMLSAVTRVLSCAPQLVTSCAFCFKPHRGGGYVDQLPLGA